jgi:hypothetical protein
MLWNDCSQELFLSLIQRMAAFILIKFSDSHNYLFCSAEHVLMFE